MKITKIISLSQGLYMKKDELHTKEPTQVDQHRSLLPFIGTGILLIGIVLIQKVNLSHGDQTPKLSPKEETRLENRLKEIDDSEQYALLANSDGGYPCLHSGRVIYYLKAGEVWKYGVTSKGKFGRYTATFLVKNNVSYFVEFKGNLSECLKQEQIKLFNYPYLPENLARPMKDRLPRPPYNPIMR